MNNAEHYTFPVEALNLVEPRLPITHDVFWEVESYDLSGRPCRAPNGFQATSIEEARQLETLCKADTFKLNVRVVARSSE